MAVTAQRVQVLRLADVWKSFDGVDALKGVTFEARAGEIHALLGENGAGKSTLMAIAAGSLEPDRGQIELKASRSTERRRWRCASAGCPSPTSTRPWSPTSPWPRTSPCGCPTSSRAAGKDAEAMDAEAQLARVGCTAALAQRVGSLSVVQRQLLEVAKSLAADPSVLILDEPTASLGAEETATLFAELRRLAAAGVAVVYITHRLAEVRELCQQVTVLRDGAVRGSFRGRRRRRRAAARAHRRPGGNGRVPAQGRPTAADDEPVLVVEHLSDRAFHDVSLTARAGEIVGLAGIVGNGQTEFLRALAGLEHATGRAELRGTPLKPNRPDAALDAGVVYLSADRLGEGLFGTLSVRENALVSALGQFSRWGVMQPRAEARAVEAQREDLAIKAPSIDANVLSLSGGNQQKVLLARALLNQTAGCCSPRSRPRASTSAPGPRSTASCARSPTPAPAWSSCPPTPGSWKGSATGSWSSPPARWSPNSAATQVTEDAIAHAMLTSTRRREPGDRRPVAGTARPLRGRAGRPDLAARPRPRRLRRRRACWPSPSSPWPCTPRRTTPGSCPTST